MIASTIDVRKSSSHNCMHYPSAPLKNFSPCHHPRSNIPPSPLHRLPTNSLTHRWRRHSPSSKISVIPLRLRVITRRVQTRLILRRPHARDAIGCLRSCLLAVKRLWCELPVRVVVVCRRGIHSAQIATSGLAIVVGVRVRRKQSLLLACCWTLEVAHLHIIVLTITSMGRESRQRILVVCTLWCFIWTRRCATATCASGHLRRRIHRRRSVHRCCRVHGLLRAIVLVVHRVLGRWLRGLLISVLVP